MNDEGTDDEDLSDTDPIHDPSDYSSWLGEEGD